MYKRQVPQQQIQQQVQHRQRVRRILEHQIEHDQHAADARERAQRQRRSHRARQLVRAPQHLHKRACALARQDGRRRIARSVARVEQPLDARRVGLVGKAAAQIELRLDHRGRKVEIAHCKHRIHVHAPHQAHRLIGVLGRLVAQRDHARERKMCIRDRRRTASHKKIPPQMRRYCS